jgi:hypothetical protein
MDERKDFEATLKTPLIVCHSAVKPGSRDAVTGFRVCFAYDRYR